MDLDNNGQGATPATILIVDDNEANRALAECTLLDEGFRVVLATGGADAIAAVEREPPDCILLDVRMPDVDGFTVCEAVRRMPCGGETPIIFLTALRDIDTFDRALDVGGDDFLTKPVRPTELLVRVQTALKLRRLDAEVRGHYEEMKRQRDALLRVQLQKERLMAFVVHDLKNPVSALDLHAQFLLRDSALSDDARASANEIRAGARQLTRMILNLLDLSKADEGKLAAKRRPVNVRDFVATIVADLSVTAERRKVTLEAALAVDAMSIDEDLVRRTLTNLVENAIRHSPAGGAVTIQVVADEGSWVLRIRDEGAGVPEEMRERIFDPFVQIDGDANGGARGGRGLGLAFCKQVAEAHHGRIWVEDAAPGAAFCVRLANVD